MIMIALTHFLFQQLRNRNKYPALSTNSTFPTKIDTDLCVIRWSLPPFLFKIQGDMSIILQYVEKRMLGMQKEVLRNP
jgi:hypothetical protein